jgi:hypothetical protein
MKSFKYLVVLVVLLCETQTNKLFCPERSSAFAVAKTGVICLERTGITSELIELCVKDDFFSKKMKEKEWERFRDFIIEKEIVSSPGQGCNGWICEYTDTLEPILHKSECKVKISLCLRRQINYLQITFIPNLFFSELCNPNFIVTVNPYPAKSEEILKSKEILRVAEIFSEGLSRLLRFKGSLSNNLKSLFHWFNSLENSEELNGVTFHFGFISNFCKIHGTNHTKFEIAFKDGHEPEFQHNICCGVLHMQSNISVFEALRYFYTEPLNLRIAKNAIDIEVAFNAAKQLSNCLSEQ